MRPADPTGTVRPPGPSDDLDTDAEARTGRGTLYRLLDPLAGLFIWAGQFLAVYGAVALACSRGVTEGAPDAVTTLQVSLVALTAAALLAVILHAWITYRRHEHVLDQHFLMWLTISLDGIAVVAIAWSLFPLLLVPACV